MMGLSATGATTRSFPPIRSLSVGNACSRAVRFGAVYGDAATEYKCAVFHRHHRAAAQRRDPVIPTRMAERCPPARDCRVKPGDDKRDWGARRVIFVAIDIGGTFTDLVGFDDKAGRFVEAKSLTTPAQLVQGIVDCIRKSGLSARDIDELIHGSTIAINTLIERKGAKTGLIVTRGTRDVYLIGRGNRPESYNLFFRRHRPLVPRHLTREVAERLLSSGEALEPLQHASVEDACRRFAEEGVEAVAVCFLHSYLNPEHERAAGEIVRRALPAAYVSLSHEILREYREFERM